MSALLPDSLSAFRPHCVRLISLLFPFVSLLVGHCVRLLSLHSFFVSGLVSLLLSFVLFPFCLPLVIASASSLLSPFVSGLISLLVGHCVRLVSLLVSLFVSHCVRLPSYLPSLRPHISLLPTVLSPFCFLLSPFLSPLLSPFLLVILSALSSFFVSSLPLSLATLHICLPAALPCNITFVSQFWAACRLQSFTLSFNSLCLPALDCCVRLCLAILYICFAALGCCVRLCLAILNFTWVSQL